MNEQQQGLKALKIKRKQRDITYHRKRSCGVLNIYNKRKTHLAICRKWRWPVVVGNDWVFDNLNEIHLESVEIVNCINIARPGENPTPAKEFNTLTEGYQLYNWTHSNLRRKPVVSMQVLSVRTQAVQLQPSQGRETIYTSTGSTCIETTCNPWQCSRHFISLRLYGVEKWTDLGYYRVSLNKHIMSHKIRCPTSVDILLPIWYPSSNMSRGAQQKFVSLWKKNSSSLSMQNQWKPFAYWNK